MNVAESVAASSAPLALIAAEKDKIVVPHRTEPLRKASKNLVLDRTIVDAGHNDLYEKRISPMQCAKRLRASKRKRS